MSATLRRCLAHSLITLLGITAAHAASADLADLSIDQLMQMPVTTAAKKQQKLAETASAVFVLSSDDIRRSGATTLPELLLTVPGVEGGMINGHTEAIGIRSLGGQWSNKLLVLIDGSSIYTRTFSGVYWDAYNIPFEDIERIEVIRGANAALWGANAVNGVVNIITKTAANTQGTLLRATAGVNNDGDLLARYGFALGQNGFARVYASGESHGDNVLYSGGDANDDWKSRRAGFRADWELGGGKRLALHGATYHIDTHSDPLDPTSLSPYVVPIGAAVNDAATSRGYSLLANFQHAYALDSEWSAQLYWTHTDRDEFLSIQEDSLDLDLQQRFQPWTGHDVVWGLNARYRRDETSPSAMGLSFDPENASDVHASVFAQDEIGFFDDQLKLTLGSRFEHDKYNGWEIQPNLRALWNINDDHKLWGAISRSARTPSRVDRQVSAQVPWLIDLPPFGVVPAQLDFHGNSDFKTETMESIELGYRLRASATLSFDLALYYNEYDDLRSVALAGYAITPLAIVIDAPMTNSMEGSVKGGELVANWSPSGELRLQGFWSELRANLDDEEVWPGFTLADTYSGSSPERQLGLRADWDPAARWSLGAQVKYVGELQQPFNYLLLERGRIDSFVDLDLRIALQVTPELELSLLGKNLLDASRLEYSSESGATLTALRRVGYLRATWSF